MHLNRIERKDILVVYHDLDDNYGFYRIKPNQPAYICLHEDLLQGPPGIHLTVFQTLLDYHKSIPLDSPYRLFPLVRYYEELRPDDNQAGALLTTPTEAQEPEGEELTIINRSGRVWRFAELRGAGQFRVVG